MKARRKMHDEAMAMQIERYRTPKSWFQNHDFENRIFWLDFEFGRGGAAE